jgi:hypothetical protein
MHGWATSLRFVMAAWVWLCGFPARAFRLREDLDQQAEDAESYQQQAKRMRFGTSIARTLADREVAPPDCSNMEDWFDTSACLFGSSTGCIHGESHTCV